MSTPQGHRRAVLQYEVPAVSDAWTLPEEPVPESCPHDRVVELLKALLVAWVARTARDALVARNLAVRWERERPRMGADPDVCVIAPSPPEGAEIESLRLWQEGHHAPLLAIEVVSATNAAKDYATAPEKYAACGVRELWVFDPKLAGPHTRGGPHRLQVWARAEEDTFTRVYAGDGPAWSAVLAAWLFPIDEGARLRIAEDREGTRWWMTPEEAERTAKEAEHAAKEGERAAKEAERAAKDAALRTNEALQSRVAELEALLLRSRRT